MRSPYPQLVSTLVVLWIVMVILFQSSEAKEVSYLRGRERRLHELSPFDVQLYFDLQFVEESLALDIETLDETNPSVVHFCQAVQTQVRHWHK